MSLFWDSITFSRLVADADRDRIIHQEAPSLVPSSVPMPMQRGFTLLLAFVLALSALVPLVAPTPARAVSDTVVISQVYGGGGNSGATLRNDFMELFNRGTTSVDVTGWSVQYASSSGSSWQTTALSGTIEPGEYYLVQQAQGSGGTQDLPTPDASGSIAMSATNGKVALVSGTTALTGACPLPDTVDFVGFGSANCFEGAGGTAVLSNTTAALRDGNGCTDTDDNATDFATGVPLARNRASPPGSCDPNAPTPPTGTGSADPASLEAGEATTLSVTVARGTNPDSTGITVTGDLSAIGYGDAQSFTAAGGNVYSFNATVADGTDPGPKSLPITIADAEERASTTFIGLTVEAPIEIVPIGLIQGSVADTDDGLEHRSAFAPASPFACSDELFTVQGVVTQRIRTAEPDDPDYGFFIQNTAETADDDPNSSDGMFVYTSGFTTTFSDDPEVDAFYFPVVGDEIVLRGRVAEFFNFTQFCNGGLLMLDRVATDRLDATEVTEADPPDDLGDANRFWERHEAMRFSLPTDSQVVAGRSVFASTADAEVWVIRGDHPVAQRSEPYTNRVFRDPHPLDDFGPAGSFDNGNGYRIMLTSHGLKWVENDGNAMLAPARTFDTVTNEITGSLYFAFGKYAIEAEQQIELVHGLDPSLNAPPVEPDREVEYSTAVYNVENLYDFRDDPFDGCDFVGNAGCTGVSPPFDYVPESNEAYQAQLADLADQIVTDLHAPDILLIQEAEDQDICSVADGAFVCGDVDDADGKPDTLQELAIVIGATYGVPYDAAYDRDGADDRGIVNGFLYRSDRVELLAPDDSDPVLGSDPQVEYRSAGLEYNTDVQNPKALNAVLPDDVDTSTGQDGDNVFTRAPQVGLFRVWRDGIGVSAFTDLYAVSNHFSSGPDGRVGQRTEQAGYNAAIVEALRQTDDGDRVVTGGDFNVFPRPDDPFAPGHPLYPSDQLAALYDIGLFDLWAVVVEEAPESAYSYAFEGQAQTLDDQFVTEGLFDELNAVRFAHVNADWPAEFDGDGSRGSSDHDPQVARFEAITVDALRNLLDYYDEQGAIRGPVGRLLGRVLDQVERYEERGQDRVARIQLQVFQILVRAFTPIYIDRDASRVLRDEADLLASNL